MARLLYPGRFSDDIRNVARGFYRQFYQVELGDPALDRLLDGTMAPR
jgi:hypothetical protein